MSPESVFAVFVEFSPPLPFNKSCLFAKYSAIWIFIEVVFLFKVVRRGKSCSSKPCPLSLASAQPLPLTPWRQVDLWINYHLPLPLRGQPLNAAGHLQRGVCVCVYLIAGLFVPALGVCLSVTRINTPLEAVAGWFRGRPSRMRGPRKQKREKEGGRKREQGREREL